MTTPTPSSARRDVVSWIGFAAGILGLLIVAWVCLTAWGAVAHGNPAYAIWLALTAVVSAFAVAWTIRRRVRRRGWRFAGRIILVVAGIGWLAVTAWLRPHTAVEPALTAMKSDAVVSVSETPTEIVLTPRTHRNATGVLFQPGALVDARAYAAVLRPIAAAGHTIVIPKQPFGIAFFSLGALDAARSEHPEVDAWVVGGHSLGGTVASMQAVSAPDGGAAPVSGLLLYASYPATDISGSLHAAVESISGTRDGLATPAKIEASRDDLPAESEFTVIDGASHAQFGDYGPQPGDDTPTITHDDARTQISGTSVRFVDSVSR